MFIATVIISSLMAWTWINLPIGRRGSRARNGRRNLGKKEKRKRSRWREKKRKLKERTRPISKLISTELLGCQFLISVELVREIL